MRQLVHLAFSIIVICLLAPHLANASSTMTDKQLLSVERSIIDSDEVRKKIEKSAVLLARYEIEAKKLVKLNEIDADAAVISSKAEQLMDLSKTVIDSARFRLPQCDAYLALSLTLEGQLADITHARLESDYHHDGALPQAPAECYHAKDLFVHPATVIVLTRDDPELGDETKKAIRAEISEVLAHTELVRQLVLY
ncbi:MAG: hypothetical protein GKR93_06800 [Gammaproteobacteria bacterium]|nr:hypothetical protein [Gammaproteobacteria bacterium]